MSRTRWSAHVHVAAERELNALPLPERSRVVHALRAVTEDPRAAPGFRVLTDVAPAGSFRVRVGAFRVIGVLLHAERMMYVTTVFRRGGPASYARALERHRARVRDVEQ